MSVLDLQKTAVAMGKIIQQLNQLENETMDIRDLRNNEEVIYFLAYICRIAILDRIMQNNWGVAVPITIPMGLFRTKKETISTGLLLTVGKIRELAKQDIDIANNVEDILTKGRLFYELDRMTSEEHKKKLA
jgi:hypothetical protein